MPAPVRYRQHDDRLRIQVVYLLRIVSRKPCRYNSSSRDAAKGQNPLHQFPGADPANRL